MRCLAKYLTGFKMFTSAEPTAIINPNNMSIEGYTAYYSIWTYITDLIYLNMGVCPTLGWVV